MTSLITHCFSIRATSVIERHNAFPCNGYYLMAGRSENIKLQTKHAPSYIAIDYYPLVNVGRKGLDLQWCSQGRVPENFPLKLALFNFKQTRNKFRKAPHTISRVTI